MVSEYMCQFTHGVSTSVVLVTYLPTSVISETHGVGACCVSSHVISVKQDVDAGMIFQ